MIVHLVRLNKCHRFCPPRFSLPSVEDLAFFIQAHSMGLPRLSLGSHCLDHLNDPFLRELESLRLSAEPGAPLLACHIDLTNAFWLLTLPEPYKNSFRVRIDGKSYAFSCLRFGWRFSPVICQYVLAFVTGSVDTSGVVVLHYLDDFLVIGYGKARGASVSQRLCDALRKAGAVIRTKSVLEPVLEIQWLGKWLVLSGDGAGVFPEGQGGAALLGLWIRAAVLPLTRKHARRILGRIIWSLRPTVGFAPFLSGPHCPHCPHCPRCPHWLASRGQGHCSCRLLTRCLSFWRRGSVWDRPGQPSVVTSQPFGLLRMSDCFRIVCGPSTGDLQSRASPHPGSRTWDRADSVSSGPDGRHHKSKLLQPLLASVGCFSSMYLKRCPSHHQDWRATRPIRRDQSRRLSRGAKPLYGWGRSWVCFLKAHA